MTTQEIAKMIDHTNLNACATSDEIERLCIEARMNEFASVCVNPSYVSFAAALLVNTGVKVCTVIGFPLGADTIDNKATSTAVAVDEGADEIDMVVNLGFVKEKDWDGVTEEISAVVDAAREVEGDGEHIVVKVILETCYLTDDEIVECCKCAEIAGADFVKTSTGFAIIKDKDGKLLPNGATVHAVEVMRKTVGDRLGVKASGGIRNFADAVKMVEAGASRIGTSAGVAIVNSQYRK